VKTSSLRLKPDSCQTQKHKTDRLTPDSRQTQAPLYPTTGTTTATFAFIATRFATVITSFHFFPHRTNGALVKSSVTDIGYFLGVDTRLVLLLLLLLLERSRFTDKALRHCPPK
jgi:hypothetical protein